MSVLARRMQEAFGEDAATIGDGGEQQFLDEAHERKTSIQDPDPNDNVVCLFT